MTKTIVLFNGPPGSGKDYIAKSSLDLVSDRASMVEKFAKSVKQGVHGMFGITYDNGCVVRHDHFEDRKNTPLAEFMGMTPREAYIWYSEVVMKPKFGDDIFGKLTADRIEKSDYSTFMVSDSGFAEEALVLVNRFGADNVKLVRMHREGHDFTGDSRSYINLPMCQVIDFRNDSQSLSDFHFDLVATLGALGIPIR